MTGRPTRRCSGLRPAACYCYFTFFAWAEAAELGTLGDRMDISPGAVDTFEPLWARAAGLVGLFVALVAIALLIAALVLRSNPVSTRVYVLLAALLTTAIVSSSLYHAFVRLPWVASYEHDHPRSHFVRQAVNRQMRVQLGITAVAAVLLCGAALVPQRARVSPN